MFKNLHSREVQLTLLFVGVDNHDALDAVHEIYRRTNPEHCEMPIDLPGEQFVFACASPTLRVGDFRFRIHVAAFMDDEPKTNIYSTLDALVLLLERAAFSPKNAMLFSLTKARLMRAGRDWQKVPMLVATLGPTPPDPSSVAVIRDALNLPPELVTAIDSETGDGVFDVWKTALKLTLSAYKRDALS